MEKFDTAKKKTMEQIHLLLMWSIKAWTKNPISCELYSEVLVKFLIVN